MPASSALNPSRLHRVLRYACSNTETSFISRGHGSLKIESPTLKYFLRGVATLTPR